MKSTVEPKRCLIPDVRRSSLEVDLRVPGNRDEFPFSLAEWSLPSYFFPVLYVSREFKFSERKPIVTIISTSLQFSTFISSPRYIFYYIILSLL